jgi:FAD/FMN-containing dehydrogenase
MLAGGWVLDTRPMNRIALDRAAGVVRVGAGTTWRELIPVLNAAGFSPKIMQSNHDFSIGGSLSVNCHSAGSALGKMLRWGLEREAAPWPAGPLSRNSIQNEPAAVFADHSAETCDVLHEYFVPQRRLWEFVQQARDAVQRGGVELLNVTVRDVRRDARSALAYAREDVFGLVMAAKSRIDPRPTFRNALFDTYAG